MAKTTRWAKLAGATLALAVPFGALAVSSQSAFAATSSTGTANLTITGGSLSVTTSSTPGSITGATAGGGTGYGTLPSATWSDTTGTGNGWTAQVATSDFSYTGSWQTTAPSGALTSTSAGAYVGTHDGDTYTVKVTGVSGSTVSFSWSSTFNSTGGTGSATEGTAAAVGTDGITINFGSGVASGDVFTVQAGTMSPNAMSLDLTSSSSTITPATGTTSPNPTFISASDTANLTGGGAYGTSAQYGTAVSFASAALGAGMGSYAIVPGASVTTDVNAWAATYTAGIEYTIASGPTA